MSNEVTGLSGYVHAILKDKYGFVKEEREGPNVIVHKGREDTVRLLASVTPPTAFQWVAIGTGAVAATTLDATLGTELTALGGGKYIGARTITTQTSANDTAQYVTMWTFSGTTTVSESGIFNNATASTGDMLCLQVFTGIPVQNGDILTITWLIKAT